MGAIYEPRGRAAEYADLAVNIFTGCSHGCRYCYAPGCVHKTREQFGRQIAVKHRLMNDLLRDCQALQGSGRQVHLCFTCDPYQPIESETRVSREVIKMLHDHGLFVRILSKNVHATRDLDLLGPGDAFGMTLTMDNSHDSAIWEPAASLPYMRVTALSEAKNRGIETWVSCEPVIVPIQTLSLIRDNSHLVDEFRVGCFNHNAAADWPSPEWESRVRSIDWRDFGDRVTWLLENGTSCRYYIKSDLWHKLPAEARRRVAASRRGTHGI